MRLKKDIMVSNESEGGYKMKKIYSEKLRELMARHLVDKKDIANIIGKSYRQTSKILHRELSHTGKPFVFDIVEASKIVLFFRNKEYTLWVSKNPNATELERKQAQDRIAREVTLDGIFFEDMLSNENKSA